MIPNSVKDMFRDIESNNLPTNIANYDKIKGELHSGKRLNNGHFVLFVNHTLLINKPIL